MVTRSSSDGNLDLRELPSFLRNPEEGRAMGSALL